MVRLKTYPVHLTKNGQVMVTLPQEWLIQHDVHEGDKLVFWADGDDHHLVITIVRTEGSTETVPAGTVAGARAT